MNETDRRNIIQTIGTIKANKIIIYLLFHKKNRFVCSSREHTQNMNINDNNLNRIAVLNT